VHLVDPSVSFIFSRMEDLRRRFEKPNEANRWDKPLFVVNVTPDSKVSHSASNADSGVADSDTTSESTPIPSVSEESTNAPPPVVFATSSWTSKKKKAPDSGSSVVSTTTQRTAAATAGGPKGVYFSGSLNSAGNTSDSASKGRNNIDEVIGHIVTFFDTAEVPVPNAATMSVRHADAELLYQLDRVSQTISQQVISHQQNHSDGTPLVLTEFNSQVVALPRYVSLAEIQRLRRQFVKINSQHPPEASIDVGSKYVEFLMNQL
jgi:tRNA uridine 5-carbamoylmethylation protein Kti12